MNTSNVLLSLYLAAGFGSSFVILTMAEMKYRKAIKNKEVPPAPKTVRDSVAAFFVIIVFTLMWPLVPFVFYDQLLE